MLGGLKLQDDESDLACRLIEIFIGFFKVSWAIGIVVVNFKYWRNNSNFTFGYQCCYTLIVN